MDKFEIVAALVKKFKEMKDYKWEFVIASFNYLNKANLPIKIKDKYGLAVYLADEWFDNSDSEIDNERLDKLFNEFVNYYNDDDGLYYGLEDNDGYLK